MNETVIDIINNIQMKDFLKNSENDIKCVECESTETININGEMICKNCGLVLSGPNMYVGNKKINLPLGLNLTIE